jgi:HEAT repeats/HEAT repeat
MRDKRYYGLAGRGRNRYGARRFATMKRLWILVALIAVASGAWAVLFRTNLMPKQRTAVSKFIEELLAVGRKGRIRGIVSSEGSFTALIDGQAVREGDTIYGATVVNIFQDKVEFEKDGRRWTQGLNETPSRQWQANTEARARAKAEAEAKAQAAAQAKARKEAETEARKEAEVQAEAAARAQKEAEKKAQEEAEAKREAEAKAQQEAEAEAQMKAAAKAQEEAEVKARQQEAAKVKAEAEAKAQVEAEAKAQEETQTKAQEEAEAKAQAEAEAKKVQQETEAKAQKEAEAKAQEEAEAKAQEEAQAKAQAEAEAKAQEEAEAKAQQEAEAKAQAEAKAKAQEEAEAKAKAETEAMVEAEAKEQVQAKAKEQAEVNEPIKPAKTIEAVEENVKVSKQQPVDEGTQIRTAKLIAKLGDKEPSVRDSVVASLVQIGPPAVPLLITAMEDEDWVIRQGASQALGRIGDRQAVGPLINALGDKNQWIRQYAAEALGLIGDKQAIKPLVKVMGDDSPGVRAVAAKALVSIRGFATADERAQASDKKQAHTIIGKLIALKIYLGAGAIAILLLGGLMAISMRRRKRTAQWELR